MASYNGTSGDDSLIGGATDDSLNGGTGNDTLIGNAGNDTLDGGAGINVAIYEGTADFFSRKVNADGNWVITDMLTDGSDPTDGGNQGTDILRNVQVLKFIKPDGTLDYIQTLDDYSNVADVNNTVLEYGKLLSGRINYYTDTDHFQLSTAAGSRVYFSGYYSNGGAGINSSGEAALNRVLYDKGLLTFGSTGTFDISIYGWGNPSSTTPTSATSYGLILRRQGTVGTEGNDLLEAGANAEYLSGESGNDTLVGSVRSDLLLGGGGNDVLIGGAGNDELDGGGGTANVAVFSDKRSAYSLSWSDRSVGTLWADGGGYFLNVSHLNSGADGTDSLRNIQILRFSDGDVVLDAESNLPDGAKVVALGETISGTLLGTTNWGWNNDTDYFKQKLTGVSTSTVLRIKIEETYTNATAGQLQVSFLASDTQDPLKFVDVNNNTNYTTFSLDSWGSQTQTFFVKTVGYASGADFGGEGVDVRIQGWAQNQDITGGLNYRIVVDRVLLGTNGSDTLVGDGKSSFIDAKDGNDSVTGSALAEEIVGGAGDDTIDGGAGDDTLTDGAGRNILRGGSGNDTFNLTGTATPIGVVTPTDTIDGGDGTDTLKISSNTSFSGLSLSSVEILDGNSGWTNLSIDQARQLGFTSAQNITFRLDPSLATGGTLDARQLPGEYAIRGTNQSDVLIGNASNNTIYLGAEEALGSGAGADTVMAGAGNDQIVLSATHTVTRPLGWQIFSAYDTPTHTYFETGQIDGGEGQDTLVIDLSVPWWAHAWGGDALYYSGTTTPTWYLDLHNWTWSQLEKLEVRSPSDYNDRPWEFPAEITLSTDQINLLASASGLKAVSIVGGGALNLAHLADLNINVWRVADALAYTVTGTDSGDSLSLTSGSYNAQLGAGDDEFVIDGKPLVKDTLDGGTGTDTVTIRGEDVDLSGATLTGIEHINVTAKSLSMTAAQWAAWGPLVQRVSGSQTGFILSVTQAGSVTLAVDSPYVGLTGSIDNDKLTGNPSDNVLVGGSGDDVLTGLGGNDRLVTGSGTDSLYGGEGNDTLVVSQKLTVMDVLSGGAGIDTLQVQDGQNFTLATLSDLEVIKGSGTVTFSPSQLASFQILNGVTAQLSGTSLNFSMGSLSMTGGARILLPQVDPLLTSIGTGILGSSADDTITGGSSADILNGGRGADVIDGGQGDDTLIGGSGNDTLIGGGGNDVFIVEASEFASASNGGSSTVYSDRIYGSEGSDTVEVNFASTNGTYVINSGAIADVETLRINSTEWQYTQIPADVLRQFQAVQFNSTSSYRYAWPKLTVMGDGLNLNLTNITSDSKLERLSLQGTFGFVDATSIDVGPTTAFSDNNYNFIEIWNLDGINLGAGNNRLRVHGDSQFTANLGAGDDTLQFDGNQDFRATVEGGTGIDTLNLTNNFLVDISRTTLSGIENVQHGTTILVVTQAQLDTLSFDGSGAKFLRGKDAIIGSTANDSFNGDGTGAFQGGKGNDTINNVNTAVFTGNISEYNIQRSGNTVTVKHERGSLEDGTDTLTNVLNLKFSDTTRTLDDAPNDPWSYFTPSSYAQLIDIAYNKPVSNKKDYAADTDVYAATLVPNSPIAIPGSTPNGNWWRMNFWDAQTHQQLQFKSLVYGWTSGDYNTNMSASQKWLPMISTPDGLKPYAGGDVIFQVNIDTNTDVNNGLTDFAFTLNYLDDYAEDINTLGIMNAQVGQVQGYIGDVGDNDWVRTQLVSGTKYEFRLEGISSGGGTLVDPALALYDSQGRQILDSSGLFEAATPVAGNDDVLVFRPSQTGTYYLGVSDIAKINTGSWTLSQASLDTVAGNVSSTERVQWSAAKTFSITGEVNALSDHDWYRVWFDKGMTYNLKLQGTSANGTLADAELAVRSITGILLKMDDNSGGNSDAQIAYSAPDSGWYFLDAGASGNAGKGTYVLSGSTLNDDYSNDVLTTGVAQSGTPFQGLVSYNGDDDWIKIGLSKGNTYVIDVTGDVSDNAKLDPLNDPLLNIRDASGKLLATADDFGGTLNARAYFTPTSNGAYFLDVRSSFKYDIGAYKITVNLAPADDFAQAFNSTAAVLTLGTSQSGVIGIPGDRDVFQVTLQAGSVYQVNAEGLSGHQGTLVDPYLRVFNAQGQLVDADNNAGVGNDAQLYLTPQQAGTYYIETSAYQDRGMGTYKVGVVQRDVPADDAGNDQSTQASLTPGQSFNGNLLTHGDQDWFNMRLVAGQSYVFKVNGAHSGGGTLEHPMLDIHAANGALLHTVDLQLSTGDPAEAYTPLSTGTYFLAVRSSAPTSDTGTYTLITRAPDDFGNTQATASTLTLNQSLDAAIQWSEGAFGVRAVDSNGLASDADEDWFKFDATTNQVLSVSAMPASGSQLSRLLVEVVDAQGRSLAVGDGLETSDGLAAATFKAATSGTYFARVIDGAGTQGAYSVTLSQGDASDEDSAGAMALNFVSAGAVTQAKVNARIGLSGDTDQFSVALQQGHSYRIETLALRDGAHAPLSGATLALGFKPQGTSTINPVPVGHEAGLPSNFDSTTFIADSTGLLNITVAASDNTQSGNYQLRVVDLGAAATDDRPDTVANYKDAQHGLLAANESAAGKIDSNSDTDLFKINLTKGNLYDFSVKGFGDALGTLAQAQLKLLDSNGLLVSSGQFDAETGRSNLSLSVFTSGNYFLSVSAANLPGNTGTYVLDTRLRTDAVSGTDDLTADTRSGALAQPGRPVTGRIDNAQDRDWIRTPLQAGKVYVFDLLGDGSGNGGTLKDGVMRLLDANGNELASDDNSGAGNDAHLQYTTLATGDYYLDVGGANGSTGTYTVRVRELYSGTADPLQSAQWYLPALGLDALHGTITGAGVKVSIIDDGIDATHPDLQAQLLTAMAFDTQFDTQDGTPKYPVLIGLPPDDHGTAVAGIIAAQANNETGIVGIAPDADLISTRVKWTWDQITQALTLQHFADVSNNSWGATTPFGDNFNSTQLTFAYQALRSGVEDGRTGKGTVFVFSAGNSAAYGENTNYHNFQNAREVITVAAANQDGSIAGFSTPGANVLVASYGVGLLTTDRHQPGWGYNLSGNYTSFSGTSAAAPVVSGVVALMLEANPNLGYRDVQQILAYASTHPDNQTWKTNAASNWNLDGLKFNDASGFGLVDAYAAVRLAQTWTQTDTAMNEVSASARAFNLAATIPDGDGAYKRTFHIESDLKVEHIELGVDLRHTRLGDLVLEVTSPSGTVSRLMDRPTVNAEQPFGLSGADSGIPSHLIWDFSSVQFWGEAAAGDWTISIKDVRAEETGTLSSLSLRVYGEQDTGNDVYVFTEEGFKSQSSHLLSDDGGIDTINAAPLQHAMIVDLPGHSISSQGVTDGIATWSTIENVITGTGSDKVVGNDSANLIETFEGDDTITGGLGNDTVDGGQGFDTMIFAGASTEYTYVWNATLQAIVVTDGVTSNGDEGMDILRGIERLRFSDIDINLGAKSNNHAPVANTDFFKEVVMVPQGGALDFSLPDSAFSDTEQGGAQNLKLTVASANGSELPAWLGYDPVTFTLNGVPPENFQGQIKLIITATDDFNLSASGTLTLQFGDNQAPMVSAPSELLINEDAGLIALGLSAPSDPEGKAVTVSALELPSQGRVLDAQGNVLTVGALLTASALTELHYQTAADAAGNMGYFRYQAVDADGVISESSVHVFVQPVNDAPRFPTAGSKLMVSYPLTQALPLDLARPTDPESTLDSVTLVELPALGVVKVAGVAATLNQTLKLDQLNQLTFSLSENVNGPIGGLTLRATDPQGLFTDWKLSLEVQGNVANSTGTSNADALYGSIGNDTLYGLAGDDTLVGNAGNDKLYGGTGNDTLLGGAGDDSLDGSSGNDYLDGGSGNDTMLGGPGNDTFIVDSTKDVVIEAIAGGSGGKDLLITSVNITAPENVEYLQAAGPDPLQLVGNALDNLITGNAQANRLDGKDGRDTLVGGAGNDTLDGGTGIDKLIGGEGDDLYIVNSKSDVIIEYANEGIDTVQSSSSYTLPAQVENLQLLEGGDYAGGGNSLDNHIWGNSGANTLSGGLGRDTLEGGLGNDVYVITDTLDTIIDTGGTDTFRSSIDTRLPDGIENAELVGIADLLAIGNSANNLLVGNVGDNLLDGGAGVDTLTGGDGADQFVVAYNGTGSTPDQITDFTPGVDLLVIDLASFGIKAGALPLLDAGTVPASSFVKGSGNSAKSTDADDYFVFNISTNTLSFDPDGTGPLAAMGVVKLIGSQPQSMTASDLFVAI